MAVVEEERQDGWAAGPLIVIDTEVGRRGEVEPVVRAPSYRRAFAIETPEVPTFP